MQNRLEEDYESTVDEYHWHVKAVFLNIIYQNYRGLWPLSTEWRE